MSGVHLVRKSNERCERPSRGARVVGWGSMSSGEPCS